MGSKAIRANQLLNTNRNLYSPTLHTLGRTTLIDLITAPQALFQSGKVEREINVKKLRDLDLWKSKPHASGTLIFRLFVQFPHVSLGIGTDEILLIPMPVTDSAYEPDCSLIPLLVPDQLHVWKKKVVSVLSTLCLNTVYKQTRKKGMHVIQVCKSSTVLRKNVLMLL